MNHGYLGAVRYRRTARAALLVLAIAAAAGGTVLRQSRGLGETMH